MNLKFYFKLNYTRVDKIYYYILTILILQSYYCYVAYILQIDCLFLVFCSYASNTVYI